MAASGILIVDDDPLVRDGLALFLRSRGHRVEAVGSGAECVDAVQQRRYDLVLLDLNMTPMNGFDTLARIRSQTPHTFVYILTAADDDTTRARARALGADGFVGKGLSDPNGMSDRVAAALAEAERRVAAAFAAGPAGRYELIGQSPAMRRVYDLIRRAAPTTATILVLGETGTGKELVARALHREGPRAARPFIPVNCAAVAEPLLESELFGHVKGAFTGADRASMGKYEAADKGTLFLDEISKSSLGFQSKLLRLIETRRFARVGATQEISADVRLIAAGGPQPADDLAAGRFLPDLYYRVNVFPIALPPLRDRVEDVAPLVAHFLGQLAGPGGRRPRVPPGLMRRFERHRWPGNIRELRNMIERALLLTDGDELADPFEEAAGPPGGGPDRAGDLLRLPFRAAQKAFEQLYLSDLLRRTGGNRRKAAEEAGIDPTTLFRKLREKGEGGE